MKKTEQINIRLTAEDFETLEAGAFVHGMTPSGLLTDLAEEAIEGLRVEAPTQLAMQARSEARMTKAATVQSIDAGRTARRRVRKDKNGPEAG